MSYTPINADGREMHALEGYTPTPTSDDFEEADTSCCACLNRRKPAFYLIVTCFLLASLFVFVITLLQMINDIKDSKHGGRDPGSFWHIEWFSFLPLPSDALDTCSGCSELSFAFSSFPSSFVADQQLLRNARLPYWTRPLSTTTNPIALKEHSSWSHPIANERYFKPFL